MARYRNVLIRELARQYEFTPRARKLEQLVRVQALVRSLEPDTPYPYDYVLFQITRFRPDDAPHAVLEGSALIADLSALLHDLSDSLDLPVEWAQEPVLTLDAVKRTYDVSLKTVRRWRAKGLIALRYVLPDGRKRTAVRQSDLEDFVEAHPELIERKGAYSYIDAETRRAIIARAFELSLGEELTLDEAVGRLACEFGSSHVSVRALLCEYDQAHPEAPIFAQAAQPIGDEERRQILALYRNGVGPDELARAFLLGRSTVERVVRDLTAQQILDREWYYVACPEFEAPDAEERLVGELLAEGLDERGIDGPLSLDQEQQLFRQYNFLKCRLAQCREELAPSELDADTLQRIMGLYSAAIAVRNCLVVANLRLVVHLASRHMAPTRPLDDLVSDGTVSLMQAIERFDYTRGVRFSTYASWAIRKNFAKTIPHEIQAQRAAMTGAQELIEAHPDSDTVTPAQRELRQVLRSTVASMLLELTPREREIVVARFGLGQEPETLEQIGRRFQITRERVRQIEALALRKLAEVADPRLIDDVL